MHTQQFLRQASNTATTDADASFSSVTLLLSGDGTNGAANSTFIDSSANNATVTRTGNTTQGSFSPFTPASQVAYSTATHGGSGFFDGTGDKLTLANSTNFNILSGGDFTVEAWIYLTATPNATNGATVVSRDASSAGWSFRVFSNAIAFSYPGASANSIATTINNNTWYHVAAVRTGSTMKYYVNGSQLSPTYTDRTTDNATTLSIGDANVPGANNGGTLTGFISSLRVVKGTAVYSSGFTPSTTPLTAITNTQALLNFTNAGIYDAAAKGDLETTGSANVDTAIKKFGTGSIEIASAGAVFHVSSSKFGYGTGDFTIEFWFYQTSSTGNQTIVSSHLNTVNSARPHIYFSATGNPLRYFLSNADRITGGSYSLNTWNHLAVCRSGTSTRMFLNGAQIGSTFTDSSTYLDAPFVVGDFANSTGTAPTGSSQFAGYIDDLRVTKGVARYTANFTAPTAAHPLK